MVEVIEHDFTEKSLDINLSYNSFYMITIFKMNLKSKGRGTTQFKFIGNFDNRLKQTGKTNFQIFRIMLLYVVCFIFGVQVFEQREVR